MDKGHSWLPSGKGSLLEAVFQVGNERHQAVLSCKDLRASGLSAGTSLPGARPPRQLRSLLASDCHGRIGLLQSIMKHLSWKKGTHCWWCKLVHSHSTGSLGVLKTKTELPYEPAILLLAHPEKVQSHNVKDARGLCSTEALFITQDTETT